MPEALVSEGLWEVIGSLLPAESPKPKGGRPRVPDRAALEGIVYVLRSGIPWRMLPEEFGCSGVTCWRRLRDWHEAGVWRRLRQALLDRLGQAGLIDWARASVDSASTPAKKGGEDRSQPGRSRQTRLETPPARRRERHAARRGAHRGQVHDSKIFEGLVDGVEPVKGPRGRPRKRPEKLHADKGYDYQCCRRFLHRRGIKARIARRAVESSQRLGRHRWVVERTLAWLSCYRRLCVRYERRANIHEAFLELGCALVCFNRLRRGL